MVLLTCLAAITVGIVVTRNLFGVVMLASAYGFIMASVMMVLDAVDVAMTEASVGAGISTVLLLAALYLTRGSEAPAKGSITLPLFVAAGTAVMLVIGTWGLPEFGSADTPLHNHVGGEYVEINWGDTEVYNIVTSVLASYRGFDTLGEVTVVFTAGIGVLLLLKRFRTAGGATSTAQRTEEEG